MNAREIVEKAAAWEWFAEAEEHQLEKLYAVLAKDGRDGALWSAWGSCCGTIAFLRAVDGPDLIRDFLRDLQRFATSGDDVIRRSDLQADAP